MTPVIIRTVPARAPLLAGLLRQLPDALVLEDQSGDAMHAFLRALAAAGEGPALHLEDDVVLAPDFRRRVEAVIAAHRTEVVNFFSRRAADLTEGARHDRNYLMAQCTYLPPGYSAAIRAFYPRWPQRARHPTAGDILIGDWLRARREKHWIEVPNLVDHRVGPSAIDRRRSRRRVSLTFGRAFGEGADGDSNQAAGQAG